MRTLSANGPRMLTRRNDPGTYRRGPAGKGKAIVTELANTSASFTATAHTGMGTDASKGTDAEDLGPLDELPSRDRDSDERTAAEV